MSYEIIYAEIVISEDIPKLGTSIKKQIKQAIETKLIEHPNVFGKPLRNSIKGYWKLRVGNYRIIFRIQKKEVKIFAIAHRSYVYTNILKRI